MLPIILEAALFITLVVTAGAVVFTGLKRFTPLGTRLRQNENRRRILMLEALTCAKHGVHDERDLVRLPGGETMCPECYLEVMNGKFDE